MLKILKSIYFQILFGVFILFFITQKFTEIESLYSDFNKAFQVVLNQLPTLLFVVILMIVNWLLEAWKWHFITNLYCYFPIQKSLQAVGSGLLSSLALPFRVGESIGRGLTYDANLQFKFGFASVISSQFQNLIIILMGAMALFFIRLPSFGFYLNFHWALVIVAALFFLMILSVVIHKHNFLSNELLTELKSILKLRNIWVISILSGARYLVYSTQFILFIWLYADFSVELVARTFVFFLLLTLSPALSFGKLGIREGIAILVFEPIMQASVIILVSSLIWIINIGIPAIITLALTAFYRLPIKSNKRICLA